MARGGPGEYSPGVSEASFIEVLSLDPGAMCKITCTAIGQREAGVIQDALKPVLGSAKGRIVLDMAAVNILGSMGLGMLVSVTRDCKAAGGQLAIFGLRRDLLELVKITKLDQFLSIATDEAAAIKKVQKK